MARHAFRFAPSPNGLLHLGHAYSALLNWRMAKAEDARFLVRIEDTDITRCTIAHAAQILDDLAWLGLGWEEPVRVQSEHFADYEENISRLWAMDAVYPCFCSRKESLAHAREEKDPDGVPLYGGTCRNLSRDEAERRIAAGEQYGWRLKASGDTALWGDAVIAKPRVGSWYHIAVVTDDHLQGITHVVRGKDIEAATPLHIKLQKLLGFATPLYTHHDLIRDEAGDKLSKSAGSPSLLSLRQNGVTAEKVRAELGFG
ncbi:glutamate--tRNA ligase family protein [Aestuariivirga sp.]|uniref:glutamate--tRNA ligase family protein n=1 Tax=Aestuariivirga sp. TaxID=2650926 RepID=UPI0039E5190D